MSIFDSIKFWIGRTLAELIIAVVLLVIFFGFIAWMDRK